MHVAIQNKAIFPHCQTPIYLPIDQTIKRQRTSSQPKSSYKLNQTRKFIAIVDQTSLKELLSDEKRNGLQKQINLYLHDPQEEQ